MMELRPYQRAAVDALFDYDWSGNPLLSLPTGSGKSIVQAAFIRETLERWPEERFLLVSHVKELLEQNASKLADLSPAIYSAGLGSREIGQVTIAGIQSIHRRAHEMGNVSIVIIDEAHLVPKTDDTMYRRFLRDLKKFCPSVRIMGMSATPYRLDSGSLILGDNRLFTDIVYQVSIKELIDDGYLSPVVSSETNIAVDTSGVGKSGGDYKIGELSNAALNITEAALDDIEARARDRKSWLVFCVTVEHAKNVCDAIQARGHSASVVVGDTPALERAAAIDRFKRGEDRALVSVGVLTTGFDAPNADCLICLRPTLSPVLWVQMVGRVTRLCDGKTNGLVLDYTNNTANHGPIDQIECYGDGNVNLAPERECDACGHMSKPTATECEECGHGFYKTCPKCESQVLLGSTVCPDCGHWFTVEREIDHHTTAGGGDIISTDDSVWGEREVDDIDCTRWSKPGKPDSLRITYWSGLEQFSEWLCLEHVGYARSKARERWLEMGGRFPQPRNVSDAIKRFDEISDQDTIMVKRDGKYWRVK